MVGFAENIVSISNKLYEHSNVWIEIHNDANLRIPGFSLIDKDLYGRYKPMIIINSELIPNDENIIAHILAHEWGHHVLQHIEHCPPPPEKMPNSETRQLKENEADAYAADFVAKYKYDKDAIINFFREHPHDLENRIKILNATFSEDAEE